MINNLSNFIKRNNTIIRILVSFIILCSILLSALSFLLYTQYSEISIKDLYNVSIGMLNQTYITADSQLQGIYNYFTRMYQKDNVVFNALYSPSFDELEMYSINKKLNEYVQTNPLVESVYIYNKQANKVFSSKTTVQTIDEFYDHDIIQYLNTNKSIGDPIFMARKPRYRIYDKWEEIKLITVILCEQANVYNPNSAMIININQQYLTQLISLASTQNAGEKLIVNKDGIIIAHNDNLSLDNNISNEKYFQKVQMQKEGNGYFTEDIQGEKYYISYYKSSNVLNWYFISIVKYKTLVSRISQLRNYVFIVTGIFIFISIGISLFLILKLYKPLHNLLKSIKSKGMAPKLEDPLNEFEFLNEAFNGLSANVSDLKHLLNAYRPAKKKEFLEKLIQGELVLNKDSNKQLQEVGIDLSSNFYLVGIIKIDSFKDFSLKYSLEDIALYRFAISNIAAEILENDFSVEIVEGTKDFVSILLSIKNKEDQSKIIKEYCRKIQRAISEFLELSTTISYGRIVDNLSDIYKSYMEAQMASEKRIILGKGSIIFIEDITQDIEYEYVYPFDQEKKILDSLKLEDIEGIAESLDKFIENVTKYSNDEIMLSLTQLTLLIVKTATSVLSITAEDLGVSNQNIFRQINEFETITEIKTWLIELCTNIILIIQGKKDKKKDQVAVKIIQYIVENYSNPDLTVEAIAEYVNLSPNHLRLIFKGSTGKALSGYITEVRMNRAQELLRQTDYPAKRISEMVGLANTSYFYTNFKKYTGKSPEQYREKED